MEGSRRAYALVTGVVPLLVIGALLAGCGESSVSAASATATTRSATCAQAQGFANAPVLTLPTVTLPTGTVAQAPVASGGGPGQYSVATYLACAPETDANLTVTTSNGTQSFATLLQGSGWAPWDLFPVNGDAQATCPEKCFALNADLSAREAGKGLFVGVPRFLSLERVTPLGDGIVTFTLRVTAPPAAPDCNFSAPGGAPEVATWYDQSAGIQFPPLTYATGDDTMSTEGFMLCSAGTAATVKAFMDHQFSANGYTSAMCPSPDDDCWTSGATSVTMSIGSATQWYIYAPRVLPTP
jgi:hypothetical protein